MSSRESSKDGTCFRYTHPSLLIITLFKYLQQIVKKQSINLKIIGRNLARPSAAGILNVLKNIHVFTIYRKTQEI
jgi:hypothetical protein